MKTFFQYYIIENKEKGIEGKERWREWKIRLIRKEIMNGLLFKSGETSFSYMTYLENGYCA